MKITKRKTKLLCPKCKNAVIGYKFPPKLEGFSCHIEHNENYCSDMQLRWNGNIAYVCNDCVEEELIRRKVK
jgi:predicted RNA-binding Zn-ribbon protein involved in translation (DUF1610 family)